MGAEEVGKARSTEYKHGNMRVYETQHEEENMDIRYSVNQRDFKRYTTQEMRDEFLITGLYAGVKADVNAGKRSLQQFIADI